jgi:hypothetical protein
MNSIKNLSVDFLIQKIKDLFLKGTAVKMKNRDRFRTTLIDTQNILSDNINHFNENKEDTNYSKIMNELFYTLDDLESKLNKLVLIKFCRDRY